jgi:hypothetical protein
MDDNFAILQRELDYCEGCLQAAAPKKTPKRKQIAVKYSKAQTDVLMNWMIRNIAHPFPSPPEVEKLSQETGLTEAQVVNWTTNVRKRNRKATVEEGKKPHHFIDYLFLAHHRDEQMKKEATAVMPPEDDPSEDSSDYGENPDNVFRIQTQETDYYSQMFDSTPGVLSRAFAHNPYQQVLSAPPSYPPEFSQVSGAAQSQHLYYDNDYGYGEDINDHVPLPPTSDTAEVHPMVPDAPLSYQEQPDGTLLEYFAGSWSEATSSVFRPRFNTEQDDTMQETPAPPPVFETYSRNGNSMAMDFEEEKKEDDAAGVKTFAV